MQFHLQVRGVSPEYQAPTAGYIFTRFLESLEAGLFES